MARPKRPSEKKKETEERKPSEKKRPFPTVTLNRALEVPRAIKDHNGGNPWAPDEIADVLGMGQKASGFYYLTAGSRDYGLTVGTRYSERIELADLGRDIVYAPNADVEQKKKIEAFLKIDIFKRVLDYYKGTALPEMKYLGNTLQREFGLAPELHEEFSRLFRENCEELGITTGTSLEVQGTEISSGPSSVLLAEPETVGKNSAKLLAFIIMPFVERGDARPKGFFGEVLRNLLTPAGRDAGFEVRTANRQGSDVIQSTIINDLLEADLVIADLTDHNPNVLFELGVRMAVDKPVALVKASGTGRIFDVDNMLRVHEYNCNLWRSTIEKDLPDLIEHIKAAWENRESDQTYMRILRRGPKTSV